MSGLIICGVHDSETEKWAARVARRLSAIVPPAADGAPAERGGETEFSGGIARFTRISPEGDTDFAGGIARFSAGSKRS